MKYIVTHTSPDWDAIGSVWILKKYLPNWRDASVLFVPAGKRVANSKYKVITDGEPKQVTDQVKEIIGEDQYIHVDTGLGPLDHHETNDLRVCAASRCWDYVQEVFAKSPNMQAESPLSVVHVEAISRIVQVLVQIDHFREIFWGDPVADYQEFSLIGVLDGLKLAKQNQDNVYMNFGLECLDALVSEFENRIEAEKEIIEKGISFMTKWGKGIGFETLNDTVLKLSQKLGYIIVLRKDPRKGYVRIKGRPEADIESIERKKVDLTLVYEKLRKIDPEATWFLHASKKMLLNGTPKNPSMVPTKLSVQEIIKVLETV